MKEFINLLHETIGEHIVEELKNGEIKATDETFAEYLYTCISDEHCIDAIAYAIASHFDINVEDLIKYLKEIYRKGDDSLTEFGRSRSYES